MKRSMDAESDYTAPTGYTDTLGDFAYRGDVASLTARLDRGDHPNDPAQCFSGAAPLFCAARYGHAACVAALLARGADAAAAHPEAGTALHGAAGSGHAAILGLLLAARAPADALDCNGDSALTLAAYAGHAAAVACLLKGGADASYAHPQHGTALAIALEEGHADVAALLRGQGGGGDAARTPPPPPPAHVPTIHPDSSVMVHGLVNAAQHNGQTGLVRSFCMTTGRYIVRLPGVATIKIKPANLTVVAGPAGERRDGTSTIDDGAGDADAGGSSGDGDVSMR